MYKILENQATGSSNKKGFLIERQTPTYDGVDWNWKETGDKYFYSYNDFQKYFLDRMNTPGVGMIARVADHEPNIDSTELPEHLDLQTLANLEAKMDEIDPEGQAAGVGFRENLVFSLMTEKGPEYVQLLNIDQANQTLTMKLFDN